MLRNLQSRMRPTQLAYKKALTREWSVMKAYKKGVGSVDDWLDKWITLYQDCVKANLPIMGLNQPVDDFAEAVAGLGDLTWASGLIQRMYAQPDRIFDFQEVVLEFRAHRTTMSN